MSKFKSLFFVLSTTLFFFRYSVSAQVLPQDSMALVAFYNATNGPQWLNHDNWLITPVSQWHGVWIQTSRVQTLFLNNNNISGTLPDEFCELTGLEYIYLGGNQLYGTFPSCMGNMVSINSLDLRNSNMTGTFPAEFGTNMPRLADIWISNNDFDEFPDLTGVPELSNLLIDGNRFTFEDILHNRAVLNLNYIYYPQDSVGVGRDTTVELNDTFEFTITVGGDGNNVYQWIKDGQNLVDNERFSGVNSPTLSNSDAQFEDEGYYTCRITNPGASLLTLVSRAVHVIIDDMRLDQFVSLQRDTALYCAEDTVQLNVFNTSGLPVFFEVDDEEVVTLLVDRLVPLKTGSFMLRIYNDGDATYKPLSATVQIPVISTLTLPVFSIQHNLPVYEGEELSLSVAEASGVTYSWIAPGSVLYTTNNVSIAAVNQSNAGTYRVEVAENNCIHYQNMITVNIDTKKEQLIIYELITPNGDGNNETFYIDPIEKIPPVDVTIFNALYQSVYQNSAYANDWDGGGLPAGTYYYIVKVKDWNEVYKGTLYIRQ